MDELDFDFFDEEKTREATPVVVQRQGRRLPPSRNERRLLRLAGVVCLFILAVALPIGLTQGTSARAVERGYLAKLSSIATGSGQLGRSFAHLLSTSGGSRQADLAVGLGSLVQKQQQELLRAQGLIPPPRLRAEHEHALMALELRLSGLQGLRQALPPAVAGASSAKSANLLAAQAARLLTSDLVWDDLFRGPTLAELAREGVRGTPVPESHFLGDSALATPVSMAVLVQQLRGAAGSGSSRGPVLKLGARGAAVKDWQAQLNSWLRIAHPSQKQLPLDGVFGPATQAATSALQRSRGITADGVVGPQTRRALQTALTTGG